MAVPSEELLAWAAAAVSADARVVDAVGLHEGGSPWRLRVETRSEATEVILRLADGGRIWSSAIATAAAALVVAAEHGLPTARLIAADLEGKIAGSAAMLETVVDGTSTPPARVSSRRLRAAGAAVARLHAIPLAARENLPERTHPIPPDDHALGRRWAARYRAAADVDKPAILDQLYAEVGWPQASARVDLPKIALSSLLQEADDRIQAMNRPDSESVFVHGDVWAGNMRWDGDTCNGLIDWKSAGVGNPGVDIGASRLDAALLYGQSAAGHVLDGWQRASGRQATDVAYWDAVAALNTPTDVSAGFTPVAFDESSELLDKSAVNDRRDEFLRRALDQLDHP